MGDLPFEEEAIDSPGLKGSIYNTGFEKKGTDRHRYQKAGCLLMVSNTTWLTRSRPAEPAGKWETEYPEIALATSKIQILEKREINLYR